METPLKSSRRRLKKVLKKSRANVSLSTNSIYQKKLKAAINVSLNSTLTMRTLQANNRSLATSLEKMRWDLRQVHDHYTLLLEENHALREKILELQRFDASEKHIADELNKRFEERMEVVKEKLGSLASFARMSLDALIELSDVCATKPTAKDDILSTESSNFNYSLLPVLQPISSDVSLDDTSDVESAQNSCWPEVDMEHAHLEKSSHTKHKLQEMSLIMEQSMLCPTEENSCTTDSKLPTVSESSVSTSCLENKQITKTRLPARVHKKSKSTDRKQPDKVMGQLTAGRCTESRRETFIITTNEPPDDTLITDIAMPQFLVSDEKEMAGLEIQDHLASASPSGRRQYRDKNISDRSAIISSYISPKLHPGKFDHCGEISQNKLDQELQLPSPLEIRQTRKQSLPSGTRSRSRSKLRQTPPKSPANKHPEKQETIIENNIDQKHPTQNKNKKNALSTFKKHLLKPADNEKQNLFISNEFNLMNAYKQRSETSDHKSSSVNLTHYCLASQEAGEHTIFPVDDMELTRMEGESYLKPPVMNCYNSNYAESHRPLTHSRSKSKQAEQAADEAEGSVAEIVPNAVTVRFLKPGQFSCKTSRKEPDGTRKDVPPVIPRVRSKSKKQLSDMTENLPNTQPQSIFDFHEKTPVALKNGNSTSEICISTDMSNLSSIIPLNKNRSRKKSKSSSDELLSECASHSESLEANQNAKYLLNEGYTFEVPLNDESPPSKSFYGTRSRSRGRNLYDSEIDNVKVRTRSRSRKQRANSRTESLINVRTSTSPVINSEMQHTEKTSSEIIDRRSEAGTPTNSKNENYMAASQVESGALSRHTELFEKDQSIRTSENISIKTLSSPKEPWVLTQSRKYISDKSRKIKHVSQSEVINAISNAASTGPSVLDTVDLLDIDSANLESISKNVKQVCDVRYATSATSVSKSQDISNFATGYDEENGNCEESAARKQEPKSLETLNTEGVPGASNKRKKTKSRSTAKKPMEIVSYTSVSQVLNDDSLSVSSELANFISTRTDRSKGRKGNNKGSRESEISHKGKSLEVSKDDHKTIEGSGESMISHESKSLEISNDDHKTNEGSGESMISHEGKSLEVSKDDHNADVDSGGKAKFTQMKAASDESRTELPIQLLDKLRHLKTPALTFTAEKVQPELIATPSSDRNDTSQKYDQGVRVSKISRVLPTDGPTSVNKRTAPINSTDSLSAVDGKRRRAATKVSYVEQPLNLKLRRGDPFTSHYCTAEKIEIYKSPKSKAKKKVVHRNILGNLHNVSIQEELGHAT